MKNMLKTILISVLITFSSSLIALAAASDKDLNFFNSIEGTWSGPGEVVAGKYKGTKFICNFAGTTDSINIGMTLDGNCRVGVFSQPMKAQVTRVQTGYKGAFNDGSQGEGLDITSGRVGSDHMVFGLNRKQLNGAMKARLIDQNSMNITVSVKINQDLIPVVGMNLKRTGDISRNIAKK